MSPNENADLEAGVFVECSLFQNFLNWMRRAKPRKFVREPYCGTVTEQIFRSDNVASESRAKVYLCMTERASVVS